LPTDLRKPLGRNREKSVGKIRRFSALMVLGVVCFAAIIGFSIFTALAPENLETPVASAPQPPAENNPAVVTPPVSGPEIASGRSGANIKRTTMPDGNVVSVFSPRPRDDEGPVLMNGQTYGQNPRMAAVPNDELLEDSPFGKLPIIGADGLRPMEQYARPWSGARGTRVAIVIGGLGLSQTGTQSAIKTLPAEVTLAFAASGNSLQRWMQEARRKGHEILIQVPLEPFGYPGNNPGPDTLLIADTSKINIERLHRSMSKITNYTGVMNYLGGRYLAETAALEPVIRDIGQRGLLFLDDGSSAQSKSGTIAKAVNAPHGFADIQLDEQVKTDAILSKLDELERVARRNGSAIGVASAFDETVAAVSKWAQEASARGVEIVGVSALVSERNEQ
jgi:polysaccharide deacetylase 2 family uncharacterized protein YibQ